MQVFPSSGTGKGHAGIEGNERCDQLVRQARKDIGMKHRDVGLRLVHPFFKIGGLTFGGGYAMLPMFQREVTPNMDG